MLFGDLEGLNKVYDKEGILIPKKNECILATFDGYFEKLEQQMHKHWRIEFFDGPGIFILTDKRLVFMREPLKYDQKFKFSGGRFAELADWEYWTNRANKARQAGAKEFIELPYNEIENVKNGKKFSEILVKSGNENYRITVDVLVGVELERLQSEEGKLEPIICFEVIDD
jgi:hypothetical protein